MNYFHLGPYSDIVDAARCSQSENKTNNSLLESLAFNPWNACPRESRVERNWSTDIFYAEEITWSCGYGPRTQAWLYRPLEKPECPRPGIILLHDHGAFKFWGKEKVSDGPEGSFPGIHEFRNFYYGDQAPVSALVRAGFTVLVHDTFLWGSRKVPYETMPEYDRKVGLLVARDMASDTSALLWQALPEEVRIYNASAQMNEHTMAKYGMALGVSLAGIVNFDDRVAIEYLSSRTDVCNGWIGCVGLSGGGLRSALLRGTSNKIKAAVIVGMMSTYAGLLDQHVICHTWLFFPPLFKGKYDWPDVVTSNFESPVLIQNTWDDELFSKTGMIVADKKISASFEQSKYPSHYRSEFYNGFHKFDIPMQEAAVAWLKAQTIVLL